MWMRIVCEGHCSSLAGVYLLDVAVLIFNLNLGKNMRKVPLLLFSSTTVNLPPTTTI